MVEDGKDVGEEVGFPYYPCYCVFVPESNYQELANRSGIHRLVPEAHTLLPILLATVFVPFPITSFYYIVTEFILCP